MFTPQEYTAKVEAILGAPIKQGQIELNFRLDSIESAYQHLSHLRQTQKELRLVKRDVTSSMRAIRSHFIASKADAQAGLWASFMGPKAAGHSRAMKREELRRQQLQVLEPYQSVVRLVDRALVQFDGAKLQLERYIIEHKGILEASEDDQAQEPELVEDLLADDDKSTNESQPSAMQMVDTPIVNQVTTASKNQWYSIGIVLLLVVPTCCGLLVLGATLWYIFVGQG